MARVTGKYDVDFKRGEGGLSSVFGTFIGTRLKENKEAYARELKAADPTNQYEILKDLMEERRKLVSDMSRLRASPTGGGSYSIRTSDPSRKDEAKYLQDLELQNREDADDFATGIQRSGEAGRFLERAIKPDDIEASKTLVLEEYSNRTKGGGSRDKALHQGMAAGMADLINQQVKNKNNKDGTIDQATANALTSVLQDASNVTSYDLRRYDDPTYLTPGQEQRRAMYRDGSVTKTSTSRSMGEGIDPSELASFYTKRLQQLDSMIADQTEKYQTASADYKQLAKGPNRNLALAPLSSRPSALSESMDRYAELVDIDPDYAKTIADKSSEEGRFKIPDRYEGLTSVAGSGGKAPIDVLLSSTDNLATLRGATKDPGEFGVTLRSFDSEDVDLVRGNLERMLQTVNSPMFAGQKYGKIESGGEKVEIGEYLSEAMSFLDEVEPELKPQLAQEFSDELIGWQQSQSDKSIKTARAEGQPGYAVSRSIGNIKKAKKDYDSTGDVKAFQNALVKEHSVINSTDSEVRGDVGNAFLSQIDNYTKSADIDYLDIQLNNLQNVADSLAVEGSGVL